MFTGIIKEVGKLNNIKKIKEGYELEVLSSLLTKDMSIGDSIAVNGCCLTVKEFSRGKSFKVDISPTTLNVTSFQFLKSGCAVNLEDALKPTDKFGGHLVSGHVDNVGEIISILKQGEFYKISIKIPKQLFLFIAPKGSIAIDGISLTVAQLNIINSNIDFAIIPFTFNNTNLKFKKNGEKVNLEVDLIARYILNIMQIKDINLGDLSDDLNKKIINNFYDEQILTNFKNKNEKDLILEEKLKKYGFKK
jgi:riboflavin synthase